MPDFNTSNQNPGASILETYINATKQKFQEEQDAQNNEVARQAKIADTDFRRKEAKHLDSQYADEHAKNLAALQVQQSQLDLQKAQLQHAHLQASSLLRAGIHEGSIPVPPPLQQGGPSVDGNLPGSPVQAAPLPSLGRINAPITSGGVTIQGNEYNAPQQELDQNAPIRAAAIQDAALHAGAVTSATEGASEDIKKLPGGAYDQAKDLVGLKTQSQKDIDNANNARALTLAGINNTSRELVGQRRDQARIAAAQISKEGKGNVDADQILARMDELRMGEGPAPSVANKVDIAARTALFKSGQMEVTPDIKKRVDGIAPVADLPDQIEAFAKKYTGGKGQAAINAVKALDPTSDYSIDLASIKTASTNFAKSIEGASSGRILLPQIKQATDYIGSSLATADGLQKKADFIRQTTTRTLKDILGRMPPKQAAEFLAARGLTSFSKDIATKGGFVDKEEVKPRHISEIPGAVKQ